MDIEWHTTDEHKEQEKAMFKLVTDKNNTGYSINRKQIYWI